MAFAIQSVDLKSKKIKKGLVNKKLSLGEFSNCFQVHNVSNANKNVYLNLAAQEPQIREGIIYFNARRKEVVYKTSPKRIQLPLYKDMQKGMIDQLTTPIFRKIVWDKTHYDMVIPALYFASMDGYERDIIIISDTREAFHTFNVHRYTIDYFKRNTSAEMQELLRSVLSSESTRIGLYCIGHTFSRSNMRWGNGYLQTDAQKAVNTILSSSFNHDIAPRWITKWKYDLAVADRITHTFYCILSWLSQNLSVQEVVKDYYSLQAHQIIFNAVSLMKEKFENGTLANCENMQEYNQLIKDIQSIYGQRDVYKYSHGDECDIWDSYYSVPNYDSLLIKESE